MGDIFIRKDVCQKSKHQIIKNRGSFIIAVDTWAELRAYLYIYI